MAWTPPEVESDWSPPEASEWSPPEAVESQPKVGALPESNDLESFFANASVAAEGLMQAADVFTSSGIIRAAGKAQQTIEQEQQKGLMRYVEQAGGKSREEAAQATLESIGGAADAAVTRITERAKDIGALQQQLSPEMKAWREAEGLDAAKVFASNPFEIVSNIVASGAISSIPSIAAGVVGSAAGPAGAAGGVGSGSFAVEFANSLVGGLQGEEVDISDPQAVQKAFADDELMGRIKEKAAKRGIAVAAFDAASAGIAGKILGPALGGSVRSVVGAAAKEAGVQALAGAAGESAGAMAAGEEPSAKAMFEEAVGELGSGTAEVAQNLTSAVSESKAAAEARLEANNEQLKVAVDTEMAKLLTEEPTDSAPQTPSSTTQTPTEATPPTSAEASQIQTEGETENQTLPPEEQPSGSGARLGPGAANIEEPLAKYEERKFGQRFQESKDIDPTVREQTGNRYYEPIPNVKTVAEAESIIDQRGLDESARLVRDESFPIEARVRSVMAQGLIKKFNQQYQAAKQAGDPKSQEYLDRAIDTAEFASELGTKLGQGVQAFAVWSRLTPEGQLTAFRRSVKKKAAEKGETSDVPKEVADEILTRATDIENTPEGFQRDEKQMDLMAYMADKSGANPADIPLALWYAGILSGYTTQMVNTVDTALNVLSEAAVMTASHPTAALDVLTGLYQGMIRGGFEAASVLRTGKSSRGNKLQVPSVLERAEFGKKGGVPVNPTSTLGRFFKAASESKIAKPLNLWKYPLRAMVASDTVAYHSMKEARARILARALAKKEGLRGAALYDRVQEILNTRASDTAAAQQQAREEGLTGNRARRRVREIQEQARPDELVSNAREAAEIATYNHNPSGTLAVLANGIESVTNQLKAAKLIVPVTRIIANVANRGLNYTPWGYKRLFFGQFGGERFGTNPPTGEDFRSQIVKATLGTTAMTLFAVMDSLGLIQLGAQGPDDPEKRRQLKATGWKPYSVKVGDTYYSYQYTPLNLGLAMIGHYRDAMRYGKLSEKDAQSRLAYGMLKSGSTILDMSFLSSALDFTRAVSGGTSSTDSAGRFLSRTATSVIPNLAKQIDRLFDPAIYQADSITEALVRETPVARGTLKPAINVLGDVVEYDNNKFFSFSKNDPVWKFIVNKQAWVPIPGKMSKLGNEPITPDQYYLLIRRSGPQIKRWIKDNLPRLESMSKEEAQDAVRDQANAIRNQVKIELQREKK